MFAQHYPKMNCSTFITCLDNQAYLLKLQQLFLLESFYEEEILRCLKHFATFRNGASFKFSLKGQGEHL